METDLSLIEISGEDDSLIQQSPNANVSISNSPHSYFSCSPLLRIPRSTTTSIPSPIAEEDTSKPSCSNCEDSNSNMNKENVNLNKEEGTKLSIEPQQMKRKKKGGGYNLRKSLAWDRAFFTEEGVLDPLELSMLSGNLGKSSGEMLSVIHEGRESLSGDSPNMHTPNNNLFKESPSKTPNQGRKVAALLPKLASPARHKMASASVAKRKVLATHDINRSASKRSGCPLPPAPSSLKRPSSINTTKVVSKDSRVSKLSAPKSDPPVVSTSSRGSITSGGRQNHNVISQPGNAQRNVGLKGNSNNTKTTRNDAKSSSVGKLITRSTTLQAKRNVAKVSSVPEIHSSSNVQSQTKVSLEAVPDSVVPVTRPAYGPDSNTRKIAVSFSQNACYNGANMQPTQPQTAKPSGLRMPSPSLRFFGQSKLSDSHSLLERSTQACNLANSNIPNFSKAGALNPVQQRPPRPSGNIPVYSSTVHSVASTAAASSGKIKSNLGLNNRQKVALQLQYNPKSYDTVNHKQQLHNICDDVHQQSVDHTEPCKIEMSCIEKVGLQSYDIKFSLRSGPSEQLEAGGDRSAVNVCPKSRNFTGAGLDLSHFTSPVNLPVEVEGLSEINNIDFDQHVEDRQYKPSMNNLNAYSGHLGGMHEPESQKVQQAEPMEPDTCIFDPISIVESQRLNGTLLEESRPSEELNKYSSSSTADVLLEVKEGGATSYCSSHCPNVEPTKDGTTVIDYLNKELHAGDAQVLSVEGNLLVGSGKSAMNTSTLENSDLMLIGDPSEKSAEQAELPNPCFVTEQVFQDNRGPLSNGCLVRGKCSEDSQEQNVLQNLKPVELRTNDCGDELGSPDVLSSIPAVTQECGFDETGKVEYLHEENALVAFADREQAAEKFSHDVKLCGEANTLALERMNKSDMIGAAITDNVEVNNIYPNRGDLCGSKLENPHFTNQISPIMQVKVASTMANESESEGAIDKQFEKNLIPFSDSQPENDACYSYRGTDILHSNCSTGIHDVKEETAEHDKLRNVCSHEAEQVNQHQVFDDLVSDKSISFQDVSAIGGSRSEIPQSPEMCESTENELAGFANSKETLMEDALEQSLDESSLADKKQDALAMKPPSNAVPFSDEWLAAFEAAGEEILARKGGAVQNSPPDKSLPEPSPWSPVRRKNNQGIGPYDCTKFTNTTNPSSTSS
ncbi:uncharacterized protein LOC8289750 [Ricinus communis]|uniref:uncharacterized protein LOC8289750 n=1 Tax=Ricinus communis TaxID=3988 RepID=UPI00201A9288|nr:uncharacterized protein LOC8289750 [Ricinus communis]